MQIKVCRVEDGPAKVEAIDAEGNVTSCTEVNVGEEVTLSAEGAVSVGEIAVTEGGSNDESSSDTETGEGGQSEGKDTGYESATNPE
jgi:hypothetical protein